MLNARLEQEFNAQVIVTAPSVPYKIKLKDLGRYWWTRSQYYQTILLAGSKKRAGQTIVVSNPSGEQSDLTV